VDSREDVNTVRSMEKDNNDDQQDNISPTSCSMSLGDFSMASLGEFCVFVCASFLRLLLLD
jgi:hypothetical protein